MSFFVKDKKAAVGATEGAESGEKSKGQAKKDAKKAEKAAKRAADKVKVQQILKAAILMILGLRECSASKSLSLILC